MLRILIVVSLDVEIDVAEYQQELCDMNVLVVRESDQFLRLMCEHNPHVIVSLGTVGRASYLWSMPLWRRSRWLNLPDGRDSASSVRDMALSLLSATCGGGLFVDEPLFSCVALDHDEHSVAQSIIHVSEILGYDNIEFLVQEYLFFGVLDLLGNHEALGAIRQFQGSQENSLIEIVRNALAVTGAIYLWPISAEATLNDPNFLQTILDVLGKDTQSAAIVGRHSSRDSVLNYFEGSGENLIGQIIFTPDHVLQINQFEHDFPLTSLSGLVLKLLRDPMTHFLHDENLTGVSPNKWWTEDNRNHQMILQASINFTRQLQTASLV
jgi:hypothetical protein